MAASRADQAVLAASTSFQDRVRQSMVAAAIAISNEGWAGGAIHKQRAARAVTILNAPDGFKGIGAMAAATDASVIGDATVGGTVVLTAANIATQQALVTDAHIDTAISGQFNSFFDPPL